MEKSIHEFVKDPKNESEMRGCLAASKVDGEVRVGFSFCRKSAELSDSFDRDRARSIAYGRILANRCGSTIPRSFEPNVDAFIDRCKRYYKTDAINVIESDAV